MRKLLLLSLLSFTTFGCGNEKGAPETKAGSATNAAAPATGAVAINGAGSTFINPLMSRWSSEYQKVDANAHVNYQSIGSGGGIRQLVAHTVQFGASDGPMTDVQLKEAGAPVVHIPIAMGAVVPTYNLPPLTHPLRLSADILADIFLGKITKWNDSRIHADNTDVTLPDLPIAVVHRSDGSGTSYIWTDYLSKVSPEWKTRVGAATSVSWPVGLGGRGNEGVAGTVKQTPGAIGYVELTYALQNNVPAASVKNRDGQWVQPTIEAVTAAAASSASTIPDDLRYSITDASGANSWPISGTTWALVYQDMSAGRERATLIAFLRWALHDGQTFCESLHYARLPAELVTRAEAKLNAIDGGH